MSSESSFPTIAHPLAALDPSQPNSVSAFDPFSVPLSFNGSASAVAFVDGGLSNYQTLVAGFSPGTAVYLLNPNGDELSQISGVLAGYKNLSSVSIFSHGSDGALQLGNTSLNGDNLGNYASVLQSWAGSFSEAGDLLFYGCNVAADTTGQSFVSQIAALTGADVAASTDLTGSSALGGDWELEFTTGSIETTGVISDGAQAAYQNLLATYTVNTTSDLVDDADGVLSLREAIAQANSNPEADTINFAINGTINLASLGALSLTDSAQTTIDASGYQITITGSGNSAFLIGGGAVATLTGLTISGNSTEERGGGIRSSGTLMVNNSTISGNSASFVDGGGIYNDAGTLTVSNSTISGNSADDEGGGLYNYFGTMTVSNSTISGNSTLGFDGGGIFSRDGTLTVSNSTISGNSANDDGGGIKSNRNNTTVSNSTISGNSALGFEGGGISNFLGTMTVSNSTISGNSTSGEGGGIKSDRSNTTVSNSIVAGNTAPDGREIFVFSSSLTSSYNLLGFNGDSGLTNLSSGLSSTGDIIPTVALNQILNTTLANNGGPTQTLALVAGSPAINAGSNALIPTGITTDQRGFVTRTVGGTVDIGAFEFGAVPPSNSPPIARNDTFSTNEDTALIGNVITNTTPNGADSDPDGNPIQIATVNGSAANVGKAISLTNGKLTLNANGSFSYIPNANANGSDSFTYTLSDGTVTSNTATVNLSIAPVNDAPTATNDTLSDIAEDSGDRTISFATLLDNDSTGPANESDQTLTITALNNVVGGTAVISGTNILFTPTANYNGAASFEYTVQDNGTTNGIADPKSAIATASFNITPVNDAPVVANPIANQSSPEDTAVNFTIPANTFSDVDNASLSLGATLADNTALPSWLSFNSTTATFSGTPPQDFNGTVALKVTATDAGGLSASSTFNLSITPVNDAPTATNDTLTDIAEDSGVRTISFATLLGNDSTGPVNESGQTLTITALNNVVGGTAVISGTNILFTPTANYNGVASFEYTVQDNGTTNGIADPKSAIATAAFNITPVNDAPSGTDKTITTGTCYTFTVADFGFTDSNDTPANSLQAVIISSLPTIGRLTLKGANVTLNQSIAVADLAANKLQYLAPTFSTLPTTPPNPASFTFRVQDNGGTANGGINTDPTPNTLTINFGLALNGGNGIDTIRGAAGNDTIRGGNGNDILFGNAGNDVLFGDNGNDRLRGGLGNDTLTGGLGNDIFILATGEGTDTITDFKNNVDKIGLTEGLAFAQLAIVQDGSRVRISKGNEVLAYLNGITVNLIDLNDFILV